MIDSNVPRVISVNNGTITIRGLPRCSGAPQESNLAEMILRLKKLWAEGDRLSHDGFQERRRARFPFEALPMNCRIEFTYTILQSTNNDVKIGLLVNCAQPGYWVNKRGKRLEPMDEVATATAFQFFTDMVISELTQRFYTVYQFSDFGEEPDYWNAPLPMLPFPYSSPKYQEACRQRREFVTPRPSPLSPPQVQAV